VRFSWGTIIEVCNEGGGYLSIISLVKSIFLRGKSLPKTSNDPSKKRIGFSQPPSQQSGREPRCQQKRPNPLTLLIINLREPSFNTTNARTTHPSATHKPIGTLSNQHPSNRDRHPQPKLLQLPDQNLAARKSHQHIPTFLKTSLQFILTHDLLRIFIPVRTGFIFPHLLNL
jgi:hypothetical protein